MPHDQVHNRECGLGKHVRKDEAGYRSGAREVHGAGAVLYNGDATEEKAKALMLYRFEKGMHQDKKQKWGSGTSLCHFFSLPTRRNQVSNL